ncbi:carbohydrate-binding protein [Gracilibacillus timonensis]|uniref:carbohydrate-binding protein n=1 Tax=Gracilibacillus timonensis TaxID=1816696 RepID=UPI00098FA372|nr:carbohydrate-binding protein [Gracilibacillus timonensis]
MKLLRMLLIFGGILMFPSISFAYSNPFEDMPDSWEWDNGDFYGEGDPYILKHNGTYYLYASTVDDKSGVKAWTSQDLVNWEHAGLVTEEPSTLAAYAPEVTYWNGAFYMYTSPGGNGHYVYKSDSPLGPFELQTENLGMGIDGHIFIDDDGQWYFYGTGQGYITAHEMEDPYTFGPAINTGAEMNGWTEGATVFKRHGKYYMTYTGNHVWSNAYRINYATSNSPTNQFEGSIQNPLLINSEGSNVGLGHNSIIRGPNLDSEFIVYHSHAKPGRFINIDRLGWNGDKMVALGPTTSEQPNPQLPDFSDRFERDDIGSEWTAINNGEWSIVNEGGSYAMEQTAIDGDSWSRQVTTHETAANYTAEFNVHMVEEGDNTTSRFGAVFSYQDEDNYGVAVLNPDENRLETMFRIDGVDIEWESSSLPEDFDYTALHNIRVEKENEEFKIYVDDMHKQTREVQDLAGGKIGYTTVDVHAAFGYIATSNQVNGSNIFDVHKPLPGSIEAVHYNTGGEGKGYHITSNQVLDTYRQDAVNIVTNPEGGLSVHSLRQEEWLKYNVNITEEATYDFTMRVATPEKDAKVRLWLDDDIDLTGVITIPHTGGGEQWQNMMLDTLSLPDGEHSIKIEVMEGEVNLASFDVDKHEPVSMLFDDFNDGVDTGWDRYEGSWRVDTNKDSDSGFDVYKPIPGSIEAVHYRTGGEGVAYHDRTTENIGGELRADAVDIREKPQGGYAVGWNQTDEWLTYNVDVQESGLYNVELELATTFSDAEVRLWLDDETDLTGAVDVPNTGDWNNWETLTMEGIELPEGEHTLKLEIVTGEFDMSTLTFRAFDVHKPLPGLLEAVDFNLGGEGIAYHDKTETNTGGEFREEGVDIQKNPEGGFAITDFEKDEWINYNVNVAEAGKYDLDLITKSANENTQVKVLLNDEKALTGAVEIPVTENDNWKRVSVKDLELPAGKHTVKIKVISGAFAFSKMIFHTFDQSHALPGKVMAVDYMTGGEGIAYHDQTIENVGGEYRYGGVDIRNHPDGTFNIGWNQTGEWYQYKVDVEEAHEYVLDLKVANDVQGSQARIWLDDEVDLTGIIDIPQTGGLDNWTSVIKEKVSLPAGEHTIKVETVNGEFDFHSFSFHNSDDFEVEEPEGVYRSGAGTFAKSITGEHGWNNYIVETDMKIVDGKGDGGILFRANNPGHGTELNHNSADMLQGYVAYINNDGVHLGKLNYDWTYLEGADLTEPIDEWQHIKVDINGANIKVYVGDMNNPKIDYTDHSITAFTHGKVGVRSFYSDTKYDNFLVRPYPDYESTKGLLEKFHDEGDIDKSLYKLLLNNLKQAEKHQDKGKDKQAIKQLKNMIKHVTKQKENGKISDFAYSIMHNSVRQMIENK